MHRVETGIPKWLLLNAAGSTAAAGVSSRERNISPQSLGKTVAPAMGLCWLFCWWRIEQPHFELPGPGRIWQWEPLPDPTPHAGPILLYPTQFHPLAHDLNLEHQCSLLSGCGKHAVRHIRNTFSWQDTQTVNNEALWTLIFLCPTFIAFRNLPVLKE